MNNNYLDIAIPCPPTQREMLSALLFNIGFEGVWEKDDGLDAYILVSDYNQDELEATLNHLNIPFNTISVKNLANINWNENWEKNYEPITVGNRCQIRAVFHPKQPAIDFDILIQPKMSFGTGHHDSTKLIISLMLQMNFEDKKVLDSGCGTGVLAILAGMKGAHEVVAIDNSPWSYENTIENAALNNISMQIILTDIEVYENRLFDVILSNITRNINHQNIPKYSQMLQKDGILLMSGFFNHDFDFINEQAIKHGFRMLNKEVSIQNWLAISYIKES